jgi:hypothetical protein
MSRIPFPNPNEFGTQGGSAGDNQPQHIPFPFPNPNTYSGTSPNYNNQNSPPGRPADFTPTSSGYQIVGPMIRYNNTDLKKRLYYASVLVVTLQTTAKENPPQLTLMDEGQCYNIVGELIDEYKGSGFWRYNISLPIADQEKFFEYSVNNGAMNRVYIAGYSQRWRWFFHSCNGFSNDISPEKQEKLGGANVLWNDMFTLHSKQPYHVQVGGGDQLYCDDVFLTNALKGWLGIVSHKDRDKAVFTKTVADEVSDFYFKNYVKCFGSGTFALALAQIPYSFVTDDHDIFDGYGSYPDRLQTSPYFQGIGAIALRFFLLFQHHTTFQRAKIDNYIGVKSFSWFKNFGSSTAIVGFDNRSERSINQTLSYESYDMVFNTMEKELPPDCKHLMVILGIPICYPRFAVVESAMQGWQSIQHSLSFHKLFGKTGAMEQILNQFGQPELLDDLLDHWTAAPRMNERSQLIWRLQHIARNRNIRITFLSGDVHCCGAGTFHSTKFVSPPNDFRYMCQIVSSAIVNAPPPNIVTDALHQTAITYNLDDYTSEDMISLFSNDVDGTKLNNQKLLPRRNYCSVMEDSNTNNIMFTLRVENLAKDGTVPYMVTVPALVNTTQ